MTMTRAGVEPELVVLGQPFGVLACGFVIEISLPFCVWQRGTITTLQDGHAFDFGEQG